MRTRTSIALLLLGLALWAATFAAPAPAQMRSSKIARHLCRTVGGGRFVDIPGFPGERIDRRLLPDIRWLRHKYDIFITDGYSTDPVHAGLGEHPIGLALDIVPYKSRGGTWREITALAKWAEPEQDHPRLPFRWVGYNGDPGHGRGNHLHLSWLHSATQPRHPARVVYTRRCPEPPAAPTDSSAGSSSPGPSGGVRAGSLPVSETGGVSAPDA